MNRYKREERQGRDTVQCLSEISHDDIVQELVHESHYSICTFKVQVHQADTTIQYWSKVRAGPGDSSQPGTQDDLRGPSSNMEMGFSGPSQCSL